MGLLLQLHDGVKVLVVDVGVDPEQTLQNGLRHRHKITLKGHALGTKEREGWCFKTKKHQRARHAATLQSACENAAVCAGRPQHDLREAQRVMKATQQHLMFTVPRIHLQETKF